jgi:basic membrane protein A
MSRVARLLAFVALAAGSAAIFVAGGGAGAGAETRPRVVLVTESVGRNGAVWQLMIAGLRTASERLDVDARVVTPSLRESYESVATHLARSGVDLVVGGLGLEGAALIRAAATNPRTAFAIVDVHPAEWPSPWPRNANAVVFREQEAGYLVGYLAGLVERRRHGRDVVAAIGGMKMPPVERFIAGFRAGARRASPGVRVLLAYSGTFTDPNRCARIASAQIERGAGVVFPVAGYCGDGALAVARRLHAWGIGVDADQSALGTHILTSAVKRFDVAVYRAVVRLVAGEKPYGDTTSLGLREGAVGLGTVSPRVPRSLVERTLAVQREIIAGRITIPPAAG